MNFQSFQSNEMLAVSENSNNDGKENARKNFVTASEIQAWLVFYIAGRLEVEPDTIDVTSTFYQHGLDSSEIVILTGDLGEWLGSEIAPTLLYNYPTIEALVQYLVSKAKLLII